MRTKAERVLVSLVAVTAGTVSAAASGCITNNAAQVPDVDSGLPDIDSSIGPVADGAAPPVDGTAPARDSGGNPPVDATVPQDSSTPEDSSTPGDTSTPLDSQPPPDANEAGPAGSFIRFAWFVGGSSGATGPTGSTGQAVPYLPIGDAGAGVDAGVDAGPSGYDVCVAPHGTGAWQGPLLAAAGFGLQPYDVTSYFPVAAGQYDVRIVPAAGQTCFIYAEAGAPDAGEVFDDGGDAAAGEDAGALDAGSPPPTDFTNLPAIPPGVSISVVLVPPQHTQIADVFTFVDDTTTSAGKAKLRFVNVSETDVTPGATGASGGSGPSGSSGPSGDSGSQLDAGFDAGALVGKTYGFGGGFFFTPLFNDVTTTGGGVDTTQPNGYLEIDAVVGVNSSVTEVGLQPGGFSGGSGAMEPVIDMTGDGLSLTAGTIATSFYVSNPPALVTCYDGVPSATSAYLTSCSVTNTTTPSAISATRFGNFAADTNAPAVDVCLKYHALATYFGPVFAQFGANGGLAPDTISSYVRANGGYSFDVRYVAAGASDCSTSLADSTFMTWSSPVALGGGYTSVLLTGFATVPDDAGAIPPYDGGPVEDASNDDAAPPPTTVGLTTLAKTIVAVEDEPFFTVGSYGGLRLVHVDALHPQPITMTITDQTTDAGYVVQNTPYGGVSTNPGPIDPYGYVVLPSDPLTLAIDSSTWTTSTSSPQSLFAFGTSAGLQLIQCNDYSENEITESITYPCGALSAGDTGGDRPLLPTTKHRRHILGTKAIRR
jgi:hypothetical protein